MTKKFTEAEFNALPEAERLGSVLYGTFYYACVHTPNLSAMKKFGSAPSFGVQLGLDEENVTKAKELGLKIKEPTDTIPMPHVEIKRGLGRWDAESKQAFSKPDRSGKEKLVSIEVVDTGQRSIPKTVLIGNGSKGFVKFARYYYTNNGGGVGTSLFKMQVVDYVPYEGPKDNDFIVSDSGFNVEDFIQGNTSATNFVEDDVPFDVEDTVAPKAVANSSSLFDD